MSPLATGAAVLLAALGVLTGNLYRPCDCHRAGDSAPCCAVRTHPEPACCHAMKREPVRRDHRPDGCRICCKPRAPMDEVGAATRVAPPQATAPSPLAALAVAWTPSRTGVVRAAESARRTIDPWPLSPEGLSVFLI